MSIEQEQHWITGEEFARENRRLIDAGVPDDAAEFRALFERKRVRDDHLFERYGKPLMDRHAGKWVAISLVGDFLIADTSAQAVAASRERFGPGNAAIRKLADSLGHRFFS